jgi:PAS domain-containing protein
VIAENIIGFLSKEITMNEEQLLEFLYIAPVALIKFDDAGNVKMANPRVAQLFNRYAPGGYFANFFQFLDDELPSLKEAITNYDAEHGQIMENQRFCMKAPASHDGEANEELWMDVTVVRQDREDFIASLNNVTNQVKVESERFIAEQKLSKVFESVKQHVIFTITSSGIVDSWNTTGETYIAKRGAAIGKVLSQLLPISIAKNAELLSTAQEVGTATSALSFKDLSNVTHDAEICISSIQDQRGSHRGFSVVLTFGSQPH